MKTIAVALFSCAGAFAQTPKVQFEVASIRPTTPEIATGGAATAGMRIDGAQFRASMPLRGLVAVAYKTRPYQFEAPQWMSSQWYEIAATLPEGHTKVDEVLEMLRGLLAERFHMKTHRETKDLPIYALRVTKSGISEGRPARSGRGFCGSGDHGIGDEHRGEAAARGDTGDRWRQG